MTAKTGGYLALAGRITQTLMDIDRIVRRAELLLTKSRSTGDEGYMDGVALNLHNFYTGIESIFEDIARTVDGAVPEGANWHQELLVQMAADLAGSRPPVIRRSTRDSLDEYRAFRHLVRNVYTFNLRPKRLSDLVERIRICFMDLRSDLEEFGRFLQALEEST
ncbi:MAG: hypothetical protein JW836_09975 [Deltaproteobacteria bacterium]|nr:hypothetical protein [Deltaproteobacteria bacterium]